MFEDHSEVWIGLFEVVASSERCRMLELQEAAYVHVLAIAHDRVHYDAQLHPSIARAHLSVVKVFDVMPYADFAEHYTVYDDVAEIAATMTEPSGMRFGTFHCWPRVM
jgi:hypothetical protein